MIIFVKSFKTHVIVFIGNVIMDLMLQWLIIFSITVGTLILKRSSLKSKEKCINLNEWKKYIPCFFKLMSECCIKFYEKVCPTVVAIFDLKCSLDSQLTKNDTILCFYLVRKRLLFNTKWVTFQLYQGKHKFLFHDMMMSVLY